MFFTMLAVVLIGLVILILTTIVLLKVSEFIQDACGFNVFHPTMVAITFCSIALAVVGCLHIKSTQHASNACWAQTGQLYGSLDDAKSYTTKCVQAYPRSAEACYMTFVKCDKKSAGQEQTEEMTTIFYMGSALFLIAIPFLNSLRFGFLGLVGFVLQVIIAAVAVIAVTGTCAVAAGYRSKEDRAYEQNERLIESNKGLARLYRK